MRTIVDFHAHIFPAKIAEKASAGIGKFYDIDMRYVGSSETLLEKGGAAGVTHYVVHSVATTPAQVQSINTFIAQECELHPEFIGFGTLHPDMEDLSAEVERIISLGLHGIKIHPDFQRFLLDEDRALPLYECIEGRLPLLVHTGDYRYEYSKPERMAHVIDMFPKLDVIAAHFGGWSEQNDAIKYLLERRCWVDTCSSYGFLNNPEKIRELVHIWGSDRLLFGSDFPMWNHQDELDWVLALDVSEEELEQILHLNAERLLGLDLSI